MRTLTASMLSAIADSTSYRMYARAVIKPSRMYVTALSYNNAQSWSEAIGIPDPNIPHGQDVAYSATNGGFVFAIVNHGGTLRLFKSNTSGCTANITYLGNPLLTQIQSKPAVLDGYLFFIDAADGYVKRATLDMNAVFALSAACVTAIETVAATATAGSLHQLSATKVVRITSDSHGAQVVYYTKPATWETYTWPRRFIFPATQLPSNVPCMYTAAAILNNSIFAYMTNPEDGSVIGVKRDSHNGTWGDSFIAVPSDLSQFWLTNAFATNGRIFLNGQFRRLMDDGQGELIPDPDSLVYSLLLSSQDGYN